MKIKSPLKLFIGFVIPINFLIMNNIPQSIMISAPVR